MNKSDYKGVWLFAEQRGGILQKVALELTGKGREIADTLNTELTAVLLGSDVSPLAEELIKYGADKVLIVDDPLLKAYTTDGYTKVMCALAAERKPEIILIGASNIGRDLGPRVAARLETGLTADCTGLAVDEASQNLYMTRPAFGGNLMATIECGEHRPQMATVRPGVFEKKLPEKPRNGTAETVKVPLDASDIRTRVEKIVKSQKDGLDITEANFIVSGGRGMGGAENFGILKELADVLGGTVGSSRAAVDSGWIDKSHQVGQTGKTVRPQIYIACGISGAIQHLAGMQESDYIIAVNKDENAPIMKVADLAIVGDVFKVIPELTAQLRTAKAR